MIRRLMILCCMIACIAVAFILVGCLRHPDMTAQRLFINNPIPYGVFFLFGMIAAILHAHAEDETE